MAVQDRVADSLRSELVAFEVAAVVLPLCVWLVRVAGFVRVADSLEPVQVDFVSVAVEAVAHTLAFDPVVSEHLAFDPVVSESTSPTFRTTSALDILASWI